MAIRILSDTSSGITVEEAKKLGVELTPMPIIFGDEEFIDGVTITLDEFYHKMVSEKKMPKTALINAEAFLEIFKDVKSRNEEMIVMPISRHLSGTYDSAISALSEVDYDKIYIVDTLQVSVPLATLVFEAVKMRESGACAKEIVEECDKLKSKVKIFAVVSTLKYLLAGGRLSKSSALIGTLMSVKPILSIIDGKVQNIHKCLGLKKSLRYIVDRFSDKETDREKSVYFVHTNNSEECKDFQKMLDTEHYIDGGTRDIGATVASHAGSGVIGLVYFTK